MIPSRAMARHDFLRFLVEGLVAGLLVLALGVITFALKPGTPQSWLRLAELYKEEDAIIVGPATHARLDGEFAFEPLGERELKNVDQPVALFRLLSGPAA